MSTLVSLRLRHPLDGHDGYVDVDLDGLTPKARALAEAIHASTRHQPLGVVVDMGRSKGEDPHFQKMHGTSSRAAEPDHRFMGHLEPLPRGAQRTPEWWLEYNAREIPYYAWPIAGARSRMERLNERVPSAEAAREDRCLTCDQAQRYLGKSIGQHNLASDDGWHLLWKAGNLPAPRHHALGGRMPLWHVDDLDAYATRQYERWTISRVAEHLGYSGPSATGTARKQISRWGLYALGREAGRGGESLYAADQVQAAHAARPGKGRRGAPREGGKFATDE